MDFLVDPSSGQSLRIRGLIPRGLVCLALGEVALPRFTRDVSVVLSLRGDTRGIAEGALRTSCSYRRFCVGGGGDFRSGWLDIPLPSSLG